MKCLRQWFRTFGVPKQLSSDGGPEFAAGITAEFLKTWGVTHRISSAYHAQSNGRAEVAVKSVKRLMRSNLGPAGTLNTDCFVRAMLQLRNTPDPDCRISPAEIVFGKPLRDNLLFSDYLNRARYSQHWQHAWQAKEEALRARFIRTSEDLNKHARPIPPLVPGDKCFVQNQTGQHANKWYHTGTVVEVLPHDKYGVVIDGSGRVTYRNRRFLKQYTPASLSVQGRFRGPLPTYGNDLTQPIADAVRREVPATPCGAEGPGTQDTVAPITPYEADAPNELDIEVPEASDLGVQPQCTSPPPVRVVERRMLRGLRDYNTPGLKELGPTSTTRVRRKPTN